MAKKHELVEEYIEKVNLIDKVLDDISANLKVELNAKNKNEELIYTLRRDRDVFLAKMGCYVEFIKELNKFA